MNPQEFIDDFYNHFHIQKQPRGIDTLGNCTYTEGCAIGRHMSQDDAFVADLGFTVGVNEILRDDSNLLPEWMLDFPHGFLGCFQILHDGHKYWEDHGGGLSDFGLKRLQKIVDQYELLHPSRNH